MWPQVMYHLGLSVQGQGAVEIIIRPGSEYVQLHTVENAQHYLREKRTAVQVLAVFTNRSETEAALHVAELLATGPAIHIVLVCPVFMPSLFGPIRIQRFVDFVRNRYDGLPAGLQERFHSLVWPCTKDQDIIEQLSSPRSIVIVRRRWWRPWGRSIPESQMMNVNGMCLVL